MSIQRAEWTDVEVSFTLLCERLRITDISFKSFFSMNPPLSSILYFCCKIKSTIIRLRNQIINRSMPTASVNLW
jgi:hypothetical protein